MGRGGTIVQATEVIARPADEVAAPVAPGGTVYTPAILLLAAIVGGSFLGLGFIMPLRALYARSIGSTAVEIGLMTTSYLLASFLIAPLIGRLTDRLGATRLLWIGLLGHAIVVVAYLGAHNSAVLLALRAAEGVTAAAVIPPARALINRLAPPRARGKRWDSSAPRKRRGSCSARRRARSSPARSATRHRS
jgi:MFS family permease